MKTIRVRNKQLTSGLYNSTIISENYGESKFTSISLISVRMNDFYESTGILTIRNTTQSIDYKYALLY